MSQVGVEGLPDVLIRLKRLNRYLAENSYLGSEACATMVDFAEWKKMKTPFDCELFPHLYRWHSHVAFLMQRFPNYNVHGQEVPTGRAPMFKSAAVSKEVAEYLSGEWHVGKEHCPSWACQSYRIFCGSDNSLCITTPQPSQSGSCIFEEGDDGWLVAYSEWVDICVRLPQDSGHRASSKAAIFQIWAAVGSSPEIYVQQQPFSVGQFVRMADCEQLVKEALASCTQVWWTDDTRQLLGAVGQVLQIDGSDGMAKVGHWRLPKVITLRRTDSGSDARWMPACVLQRASEEEVIGVEARNQQLDNEMGRNEDQTLPFSLPVVSMSGERQAVVTIRSFDSQVRELKTDVAQQAGIPHTAMCQLFAEGDSSPLQDTARLQSYRDTLCGVDRLLLVVQAKQLPEGYDYAEISEPGLRRLRNEVDQHTREFPSMPLKAIKADLSHLEVLVPGPFDCPYEDGKFLLDIIFHEIHPFQPPLVQFITKVYHCNIGAQTGKISLDTLHDQWSPALNLSKVLLSIQSLLFNPNPHDPIEAEAARLYLEDRQQHDAKVREWVRMYAL